MATFEDAWRKVKLRVPMADAFLVRDWVQNAYKQIADAYPWHFLFSEVLLRTAASATRTVGVTQDSVTVTGAGFVAGDVTRQFRVGDTPVYTIVGVTAGVDATLDKAYAGSDAAAASATIQDIYARMPADFGALEFVWDLTNGKPIFYGFTQADLAQRDPSRAANGDPTILADWDIENHASLDNRVRYEWWERPTAENQYAVLYKIRPADLVEQTDLRGVFGVRPDVLVAGALAEAALWPGPSVQARNPYFSMALRKELKAEFDAQVLALQLRDDDQRLQSWFQYPWERWQSLAGDTAVHLRQTDASLADFA